MELDNLNNIVYYRDERGRACYGKNTEQGFEQPERDETTGKIKFGGYGMNLGNNPDMIADIPIQIGNKFKVVTGSNNSNIKKQPAHTPEEEWRSILGIPSGGHSWIEIENNQGNIYTFGLTYDGKSKTNTIASPDYVALICRNKLKKCLDIQERGGVYTNKNKTLKINPDEDGGCKNVCNNMVSYSDGKRNKWTGQSTRVPQKSISNYTPRFNVRFKGTLRRVHIEILQKLLDDSMAYVYNKKEIIERPETPPIYQLMTNIPSLYSVYIDVPGWLRPIAKYPASALGLVPTRSSKSLKTFTNNLRKINKYKELEGDPEKLISKWKNGDLDLIANCQSFANDFVHEPLKLYRFLHDGQDFNDVMRDKISDKEKEILEIKKKKESDIAKLRWNMLRRSLKKTKVNSEISQLNNTYNNLLKEKENITKSLTGNNRTRRRKARRGRTANITKRQREILLEKERLKRTMRKNERSLYHERRRINKNKKNIIKNVANKKTEKLRRNIIKLNKEMNKN